MRRLTWFLGVVALLFVVGGVFAALQPVHVYSEPDGYVVERRVDEAGRDRIYMTFEVEKLRSCDLESGDGPPWVEFYDASTGVPPPSAFFKPDGMPAGETRSQAGERLLVDGYSAIVPAKLLDRAGTFSIRIPCQLWTGESSRKEWGRKIISTFGPLILPAPGERVEVHGEE